MKTTNELLAIIDDICPTIKSSEKLFIVGLVLDEQAAAYKEAVDKAMDNVSSMSEYVDDDLAWLTDKNWKPTSVTVHKNH